MPEPIFKPDPPAGSAEPHVLVIEDNTDELRLLLEALRNAGYRLSVALDGVKGYSRAIAFVPDLILLDVHMPGLDGFSVCRRLKANPATARVPIIFLSSEGDIDARLTGLRDGGVDYILKPFSSEEVLARVRIHLTLSSSPSHGNKGEPTLSEDQVLVRAAKHYLSSRLGQVPSSGELLESLGVSERRLSNAFRQCLGVTVFEYLRQERMRVADRLLAETSLSIVAISEEMGFSSAANFSTAFRDHAGVAPSVFRRNARTEASKFGNSLQ